MADLRVLPKGLYAVPDYEALTGASSVRKHGWRLDLSIGPKYKDPRSGQMMSNGSWVRVDDQVITIPEGSPHWGEYIRHLQGDPRVPGSGELWPADLATAQTAGVRFDPTFGGEHPAVAASLAPKAPGATATATATATAKTAEVTK